MGRGGEKRSPHLVHGTMPLALDRDTGFLRFADLGPDGPEDCIASVEALPDAEIDLIVFHQSSDLAIWRKGVMEVGGNAIETVVPPVNHPRFLLLIRHDRPGRPGQTIDEAIALRHVTDGLVPANVAAIGKEARDQAANRWKRAKAMEAFEKEWAEETATVEATPGFTVDRPHSASCGSLSFSYDAPGEIKGLGPRFTVTRTSGGGYEATWSLGALHVYVDIWDRVDEEASGRGITRDGTRFSCRMANLDGEWLAFLAQSAAALDRAAKPRPQTGPDRQPRT